MYITWQQANDLHLLSTKIQPYDSILKPRAYTSLEGILGGLIRGGGGGLLYISYEYEQAGPVGNMSLDSCKDLGNCARQYGATPGHFHI